MANFKKDTILKDILKDPKIRNVLKKYNLPCLACPFARFEINKLTIGEICDIYGIDANKLLKELNKRNVKKKK